MISIHRIYRFTLSTKTQKAAISNTYVFLSTFFVPLPIYYHRVKNAELTLDVHSAIFNSVIVLRKLAKPVTEGEPAGLSLFHFRGANHESPKNILYIF